MTRRILVYSGIGVATLLLAVALLLAWFLGTQSGTRLLWDSLCDTVDGLTIESVEGRLSGPLFLRELHYETDTMRITIGSLQLDWVPASLLKRKVLVQRLHIDDVVYTQLQSDPPPAAEAEPFSMPEQISLPLALDLRDIRLRTVARRPSLAAEPLQVDEATLVASFQGADLSIAHLSAYGPLFRVEGGASVSTNSDFASTISLDWQAFLPDLAPLTGSLSVHGNLSVVHVEQTIAAPYNLTQQIELHDPLGDDMRLDARININDTELRGIGASLPVAMVNGTLLAKGRVSDLSYRVDLNAQSEEYGALELHANGDVSGQVVTVGELLLSRGSSGASLGLVGRANLAGPTPTFSLRGDWRDLDWPLSGEPRIRSERGAVTVDGNAEDYSVALTTALTVPGHSKGQLTVAGHGDTESFELVDLELALLDGVLTGRGDVRWRPQLSAAITLDGEGLNPAVLSPDFPGSLQIALRAAGGISDGVTDVRVDTLSVSGTFREQPLDVQAAGTLENARLNLDTLVVRSGETRLNAVGHLGDRMNLQWDIVSPDLGDLLPGASGSLAGSGSFAGSLALPLVRADLQGDAIVFADYQLQRLSLEVDIDLEREAPSRLQLILDEASLGDLAVHRASLSGLGKRRDHQLDLQLDSSVGVAQLSLAGDLGDDEWRGELRSGALQYPELAAWHLVQAQALRVSVAQQQLERGCWQSGDASLCLQGRRAQGDVDAAMRLDNFSLDDIKGIIPDAFSLAGLLNAQVNVRQKAGSTAELEVVVGADGVELRSGESSEQPDELLLGLEPSSVSMNYGDSGVRARVSMPFTNGGGIDASAQVGEGSDPVVQRPLQGKLVLALDDIAFLRVLSSEIDRAGGAITGELNMAGTLQAPLPDGEIKLKGGALALAGPGLSISNISARASSRDGFTVDFDGSAASGEGTLSLGGSVRLDGGKTALDIDIEGNSFEVMNTVDARVFVSPDLQISLRENGLAINGEVRVPRAEITPQELPASVVSASRDEVIMSDGSEVVSVAVAPPELQARIRVTLGEAVSLDGFGLKARLAGGLTVTQTPGKPTLGSGEVDILEGEYRAYGQGLVIESGKILFAGGPISQPGINVRALRRPAEAIVVGVSVRGPLQNPDFSVFSEPGMTQSEQLSWLVLGRPLQGASEGEGDMIAQAALALGLQGGNMLADRIGGGLGVDSLGIETGTGEAGGASDANQAALVIGKYLSPGLFVSYGIGLFDSVSTVRLEYTLTDSWKVSTESSTLSSGGDVTYTIER